MNTFEWPEGTAGHLSNTGAEEAIRQLRPFYTSIHRGVARLAGLPGPARWNGHLPEEYHEVVLQAEYVVYSYRTPIAWLYPNGNVAVPDVGHSQSTAQHQLIACSAWRELLPSGFRLAHRGRPVTHAGGGPRAGGIDGDYRPPFRVIASGPERTGRTRRDVDDETPAYAPGGPRRSEPVRATDGYGHGGRSVVRSKEFWARRAQEVAAQGEITNAARCAAERVHRTPDPSESGYDRLGLPLEPPDFSERVW